MGHKGVMLCSKTLIHCRVVEPKIHVIYILQIQGNAREHSCNATGRVVEANVHVTLQAGWRKRTFI